MGSLWCGFVGLVLLDYFRLSKFLLHFRRDFFIHIFTLNSFLWYFHIIMIEWNIYILTWMRCYKMVTRSLLPSRKNNIFDNIISKEGAKWFQWIRTVMLNTLYTISTWCYIICACNIQHSISSVLSGKHCDINDEMIMLLLSTSRWSKNSLLKKTYFENYYLFVSSTSFIKFSKLFS